MAAVVFKSPVAVTKVIGAVVTLVAAFGFDLDPALVVAALTFLAGSGLFEYRQVSPVPAEDRGFSGANVESTADLLARRIEETS
jgi:hypothetical protein